MRRKALDSSVEKELNAWFPPHTGYVLDTREDNLCIQSDHLGGGEKYWKRHKTSRIEEDGLVVDYIAFNFHQKLKTEKRLTLEETRMLSKNRENMISKGCQGARWRK